MLSSIFKHRISSFLLMALFVCGASLTSAQTTTTEFTYQGTLNDNSIPANANYDFEFRLFAVSTDGTPIGARTRLNVAVTNGGFTVQLDFLPAAFNGSDRFLEIAVKPAGSLNQFSTLHPRQQITHAPYAFHSLNAETADLATNSLRLGGVEAREYVQTTDTRLTDARPPLPGSGNYIRSDPATVQSSSFNIIGKGSAGTYDVITNYQIGGNRVVGIPGTNNIFVGVNAGIANTSGEDNAFFGRGAGFDNTEGSRNSFFGRAAGQNNLTASGNAFFGFEAGRDNTADFNAFFGSLAGQSNSTGTGNSFFGRNAGNANTTSTDNSFFGYQAGQNSVGFNGLLGSNSFFGSQAGRANTTGRHNSFFGATSGDSNTSGSLNVFVGNNTGSANTTGGFNIFVGPSAGSGNITGSNNTIIGANADVGSGNLSFATAIGAFAVVTTSDTIVLGRSDGSDYVLIPGFLTIPNLAVAGNEHLCRNSFDRVGSCSSSLRYKTNVQQFFGGLDIVNRLRPITFNWKDGGMHDVGFAAEEVEQIEPLLATHNKDGQIEGVRYGQITTVLVNAVHEQQTEIELLKQQVNLQLRQIDALKRVVCLSHPASDICK